MRHELPKEGIRNVVFDFGGVLVDYSPHYLYDKVIKDPARLRRLLTEVITPEWTLTMDTAPSFTEAILQRQREFPEFAMEIGLFQSRWEEMIGGALTDQVCFLERLKASGYRCYGLSNCAAETYPRLKALHPFFNLLDGVVLSGETGLVKPDRRMFHILLERYGLKAKECLFLDDRKENLEAAREMGFKTLPILQGQEPRATKSRP